MMKNKKIQTILIILLSLAAYGTTYTIKDNGKVYSSSGTQIQSRTTNYYNTYTPNNYVSTNAVRKGTADAIEIVMDFSGSMVDWIDIAKLTMTSVVAQISPQTLVGFRVFGQNTNKAATGQVQSIVSTKDKKGKTVYKALTGKHLTQSGACSATEQVSSVAPADASRLIAGMNTVDIGGSTPMVLGLQKAAYGDFSHLTENMKKKIILITDGGENCGGDPCYFAKTLMRQRSDITIDVILVASNSNRLQCVTKATNGNFYKTKNLGDFSKTLVQSMTTDVFDAQDSVQQGQGYEFIQD